MQYSQPQRLLESSQIMCTIHPNIKHDFKFIKKIIENEYFLVFCCKCFCIKISEHKKLCCIHENMCPHLPKMGKLTRNLLKHHSKQMSFDITSFPYKPFHEIMSINQNKKRKKKSFLHGIHRNQIFRNFPILRLKDNELLKSSMELAPLLSKPGFKECNFCAKKWAICEAIRKGNEKNTSNFLFNIRKHLSANHFSCACSLGQHKKGELKILGLYGLVKCCL